MRLFKVTLVAILFLALTTNLSSGLKIWKTICKPTTSYQRQFLFSYKVVTGVKCRKVLVKIDPFIFLKQLLTPTQPDQLISSASNSNNNGNRRLGSVAHSTTEQLTTTTTTTTPIPTTTMNYITSLNEMTTSQVPFEAITIAVEQLESTTLSTYSGELLPEATTITTTPAPLTPETSAPLETLAELQTTTPATTTDQAETTTILAVTETTSAVQDSPSGTPSTSASYEMTSQLTTSAESVTETGRALATTQPLMSITETTTIAASTPDVLSNATWSTEKALETNTTPLVTSTEPPPAVPMADQPTPSPIDLPIMTTNEPVRIFLQPSVAEALVSNTNLSFNPMTNDSVPFYTENMEAE